MERRGRPRSRVSTRIYLFVAGQRERCRTVNVSQDGAFVGASSPRLRVGAEVELVFILKADTVVRTQRITAAVTRVTEDGAGLRFIRRVTHERSRAAARQA